MQQLGQVGHENLSAQVYRRLRTALLDGQLEPGERLRIAELAKSLGTSITPVREAIFRLVSEQALEIKASTAVYVPIMDAAQIDEILTMRILLEGAAAERAATRISPAGIEELARIQEEFIASYTEDPYRTSLKNREFHFALMRAAEMPLLQATVESFWVKMGGIIRIFLTRVPKVDLSRHGHGHFDVLDGLRRRDGQATREAIQRDLAGARIMVDLVREWEAERAGRTAARA
ncbi:GntR family transcriptional regulator [Azospirillum sp. RWY-5-1]|uniref:GntR family transcriptional regulator n=1 Tax=Azospirillum oleiclasticum TaxID=2735135 RepID=A0ABX2T2I5_9PROT|nr:GntR family transcriptional regulator [Azospirillum oleiclasticum]NYZ11302.1 GntR family transcriptional regulator [Azospirillum oleiclasticum]NYZ18463.1 GntR family transcriptional regulator [Azospirillum oleiclasticum]